MSTRLADAARSALARGRDLLAAVCAVAVSAATHVQRRSAAPQPEARSPRSPARAGRRRSAGTRRAAAILGADTEGVAHPTLPCGARIFITYDGKTVLTQVVDRGPYAPGRQFDLTDALARRLGLRGVQPVHWSYARAPG